MEHGSTVFRPPLLRAVGVDSDGCVHEPSWHGFLMGVSHELFPNGQSGTVHITTKRLHSPPVLLGSVLGPQMVPLHFQEEDTHDPSTRGWSASYGPLCQAGTYSLVLRLLFREYDAANPEHVKQQVRRADYIPFVDQAATSWRAVIPPGQAADCTPGWSWAHGPPSDVYDLLTLKAEWPGWVQRELRYSGKPTLREQAAELHAEQALLRGQQTLCFVGDSHARNLHNSVFERLLSTSRSSNHSQSFWKDVTCNATLAHIGSWSSARCTQGHCLWPARSKDTGSKILRSFPRCTFTSTVSAFLWQDGQPNPTLGLMGNGTDSEHACTAIVVSTGHWDAGWPGGHPTSLADFRSAIETLFDAASNISRAAHNGPLPILVHTISASDTWGHKGTCVDRNKESKACVDRPENCAMLPWVTPHELNMRARSSPDHHPSRISGSDRHAQRHSNATANGNVCRKHLYTNACGTFDLAADWRHNGLLRAYRQVILDTFKQYAERPHMRHTFSLIDTLPVMETVQEFSLDGCHYNGGAIGDFLAGAVLQALGFSMHRLHHAGAQ